MKNIEKNILLILATVCVDDHNISITGIPEDVKEEIELKFENTPRIESGVHKLIGQFMNFHKKDIQAEAKKNPELKYDRILLPLKPKELSVLDSEPGKYTYKTLRSLCVNYMAYFEKLLENKMIPIGKDLAVCIVPVLLNRELYDLSQKMMHEYQTRSDKTQDYYKFLEYFSANRRKYFYTIFLSQNHVL